MNLPSQLGIPLNALLSSGPKDNADLFPGINGIVNEFEFGESVADGNAAVGLGFTTRATANGVAGATGNVAAAFGFTTPGEPGHTGVVTAAWAEYAVTLAGESVGIIPSAWMELARTVPGVGQVTGAWIEYAVHIPPRSGGSIQGESMTRFFRVQGSRLEKTRGNLP